VQPLLGQLLAGEGGAEIGVACAVGLQHRVPMGGVGAVIRGLAAQTMDEGLIAARFEAALQASDVSRALVEQSRRLDLGSFALEHAMQNLEDITFLLAHGNPVWDQHVDRHGSSLAWARRTFLSR